MFQYIITGNNDPIAQTYDSLDMAIDHVNDRSGSFVIIKRDAATGWAVTRYRATQTGAGVELDGIDHFEAE